VARAVACFRLAVAPLDHDVYVYPFTSRVLKTVALLGPFSHLKDLILSRDRYKPVFISMLSDSRGRRLYSLYNSPPQVLGQGEVYYGRVCLSPGDGGLGPELLRLEGRLETPFGELWYGVLEAEYFELDRIAVKLEGSASLRFATPAIVSPKIYSRSSDARGELVGIPSPGAVLAYALKLYNSLARPEHRLPRPCDDQSCRDYEAAFAARATACTGVDEAELHTVVVDIGKGQTKPGFEGSMRFTIACSDVEEIAEKVLPLANLLGIGKGRGLGLGEIEITTGTPHPRRSREMAEKKIQRDRNRSSGAKIRIDTRGRGSLGILPEDLRTI